MAISSSAVHASGVYAAMNAIALPSLRQIGTNTHIVLFSMLTTYFRRMRCGALVYALDTTSFRSHCQVACHVDV
eukprot:20618-Heterococcus_DN1.PRE.1